MKNIFESNIINIYQSKGKEWLYDLPNIIKQKSKEWGLYDLQPINNLSYNYILSGF